MLSLLIDENLNHRILRGLKRTVPHLDYVAGLAEGHAGIEQVATHLLDGISHGEAPEALTSLVIQNQSE